MVRRTATDWALMVAVMASILAGGAGRFLGELPHLVGHHRETAPLFAGPGQLDGGVEGEGGWSVRRYP